MTIKTDKLNKKTKTKKHICPSCGKVRAQNSGDLTNGSHLIAH